MKEWNESNLRAMQNKNNSWYAWQKERLKVFLLQGFPQRKLENWKYTSVSPISEQLFTFSKITDSKVADIDITSYVLDDVYRLVFINGNFVPCLSDLSKLPPEVQLTSLNTVQREIQNQLTMLKDYQTPFSVMNDALFQEGLFVHIPKNCCLEKPIHLIYLSQPTVSMSMSQIRHLIILEENTKATIFEDYHGVNDSVYFNNIVTQINVGSSAQLEFYKLQQEGDKAFHIANTVIHQNYCSQVTSCYITLGSKLSRDDLNYSLDESSASCQLLGFYYINEKCHVDHHTRINHRAAHCSSQQNYKGILTNQSRGVFNGKIIVHQSAKQTIAHQTNKNLILSLGAEVDVKPELEIYNDDVKCTHGATIGQLSKELLFYMQSRGIHRSTAEYLLTCAFANEVLEMLSHKIVAERIQQKITEYLTTLQCQRSYRYA